jgi:hypothetical protein
VDIAALQPLDVLCRSVDQEIDVFRGSNEAVGDNGKAANQDVPRARRVQRFTEGEEVFELRCA